MKFGLSLTLWICSLFLGFGQMLKVPNATAKGVDQLRHSRQACGPAALLNQYKFGGNRYQDALSRMPYQDDLMQLRWIIGHYGHRPSPQFPQKSRWSYKSGMSLVDLESCANEMARDLGTAQLNCIEMNDLAKAHRQLKSSIKRGTPPILQLRRLVRETPKPSSPAVWLSRFGHFVLVIEIQEHFASGSPAFTLTYFDPWKGKKYQAHLLAANPAYASPHPIAQFPEALVGRDQLKASALSQLVATHALGQF